MASPKISSLFGSWLLIDLDKVSSNVQGMRSLPNSPTLFAAVIKANAYGLGALEIASHLVATSSIDAFVVASVEEGVALRLSGITLPVLVTAGSFRDAYDVVLDHSLTPAVGNEEDLLQFSTAAVRRNAVASIHIEVDVDMARNGFDMDSLENVASFVRTLSNVRVYGVMGHPAHAECFIDDPRLLDRQIERLKAFHKCLELSHSLKDNDTRSPSSVPQPWLCCSRHSKGSSSFAALSTTSTFDSQSTFGDLVSSPSSAASSVDGALSDRGVNSALTHFVNSANLACSFCRSIKQSSPTNRFEGDMSRIGLAMYGIQPLESVCLPGLVPVLRWQARVVALRSIAEGKSVGYDGTWTARRQTRVATICVGYADGYPRSLSNKAQVTIDGRRANVIGRVCMDYTMIDVTDFALDEVKISSYVTLISDTACGPSVKEVAEWASTIPWEIISRISPRVKRIHSSVSTRTFASHDREDLANTDYTHLLDLVQTHVHQNESVLAQSFGSRFERSTSRTGNADGITDNRQ